MGENPLSPAAPEQPTGQAPGAAPVARALVCGHCHKGKLDPAGRRPGEEIRCPLCGKASKVTLEMTLGEERILERQKSREQAKRTFRELSDEEKLEFLARQSGVIQMYYYLQYQLGPRGMVAIYLGLFVLFGGLIITYLLTYGGMELRTEKLSVGTVLLWVLGGAFLGLVGWFVHTTVMFYYQKSKAAADAADPRRGASSSRRTAAIRNKPSSTRLKPPPAARTR
jgi:hypothetical protein